MHAALSYLGTLPPQTVVYNGHEYTTGNLTFAKSVDPQNPALARLDAIVSANKITTGLTTIGDEKEWNPFMRLSSEPIKFVNLFVLSSLNNTYPAGRQPEAPRTARSWIHCENRRIISGGESGCYSQRASHLGLHLVDLLDSEINTYL